MKQAILAITALALMGPARAQDTPPGMTPIISAKYGERICGYKVNLERLADHIQRASGTPAPAILQDPELPAVMDRLWKRYNGMGKAKACPAIFREYGPRGTVARGVVSR